MLKREQLHEYQKTAISRLITQPKNYLALDMGLGKTVSTLTAIADLEADWEINKTLIIAPLRVANTTWHKEIENWEHLKHLRYSIVTGTAKQRIAALQKDAEVYIINRENVPWLCEYLKGKWCFDNVVIDEASSFKSNSSKRFKTLRKMLPKIDRMTLLSGTPSPQGLLDLWSQFYLLDSGERLGRTMTAYKNRWFDSDYMGYSVTPKEFANDQIHSAIDDVMISMKAEDYLELPKLNNVTVTVPLQPKVLKQYKELEAEMIAEIEGEEIAVFNAAALANKLLQFANGCLYTDEDGNYIEVHDAKIKALAEIVEDNPNECILVAYNYKTDLERLQKAFPHAELITDENVERWNNGEIKMMLAHPASAGHGLNLQKNPNGNTCVWFGLNWSLELRQQFDARLYRQGKDRPVTIIDLVSEATIDSRVQTALKNKCSVQDALMMAMKA